MADIYLYPITGNNIHVYQGTDLQVATTIYTDSGATSTLDLTGYTFTARFYRKSDSAQLAETTALNNHNVVAGQVIINLQDTQLGEENMDTVGSWDLIGTDTQGTVAVYDYGSFNVKDNPASS